MKKYEPVILETPYAGNIEENVIYAQACMKDSLMRGEAPFLSHLLYTQCLNDNVPVERQIGIEAGFAFKSVINKTVVYQDYGISKGMIQGINSARENGNVIEYRNIL